VLKFKFKFYNLKEAKQVLSNAIQIIQNSVSCNNSFSKNLVTDIETCQSALKDQHAYNNYGGKMLKMNNMAHNQQRVANNNNNNWGGQGAYMNFSKMSMQNRNNNWNNNNNFYQQ